MKYADFVIRLIPDAADTYRSRILLSPKGKGTARFGCPFDPGDDLGLSKREIGERLYRALFVDILRERFEASWAEIVNRENRGLRIKLN